MGQNEIGQNDSLGKMKVGKKIEQHASLGKMKVCKKLGNMLHWAKRKWVKLSIGQK